MVRQSRTGTLARTLPMKGNGAIMLVLVRKSGQSVEIDELGITIKVLKVTGSGRVKLGFKGPKDIRFRRTEVQPLENQCRMGAAEPRARGMMR